MSRDFLASQQGREFKRSPNRDRITRGSAQYTSAVFYVTNIPVFFGFKPTNTASEPLIDEPFYTRLRSTLEFINTHPANAAYLGKKTIEEWIYNPVLNRRERISFYQDDGFPNGLDPRLNVTEFPVSQNPTVAVDTSIVFKRTLELMDQGGTTHSLIDRARQELTQLEFPQVDTHPNNNDGLIPVRNYQRLASTGALEAPSGYKPPGFLMPKAEIWNGLEITSIGLKNPMRGRSAIIRLQKTKAPTKPGLKWSLRVPLFTAEFLGYYQAANVVETGCAREFQEPVDRVYYPDVDAVKEDPGAFYFDLLFGPVAWTQVLQVPPFPGTNYGPSSAGYPKPTCYQDIT